jgi:hypothetical protein
MRRVLPFDPKREIEAIDISPDGRWAAVGSVSPEDRLSRQLDLYELASWTRKSSPAAYADHFAFTGNSKHLIIRKTRGEGSMETIEWLEARNVPAGRIVKSWVPGEGVSLRRMHFLSSRPTRMVTGAAGTDRLAVCNVFGGTVVRKIVSDRAIAGVLVDPAGRWAIGEVSNGSQETSPYWQDLRAWDLETGERIFEAPRVPWKQKLTSDPRLEDKTRLLGVSNDGRHILSERKNQLHVHEVTY